MTREEAIKLLVNATYSDEWQGNEDLTTAHNMAIKALSQEPTKREIEREYLFQSLCEDFKKLQAENDDLRKRLEQEPCDDAVSREAVMNIVKDMHGLARADVLSDAVKRLKELPPVTQKSGKWIDYRDDGFVECPFCGHATNCEDNIDELHYCFYCGARMESEEKE